MKFPIKLRNESCRLWKHDSYTRDVDYIVSVKIYEYDMKDAGFNLIKYFELLPKGEIDALEQIPKVYRTIKIGMLQRKDQLFAKRLNKTFAIMRQRFFEENGLMEDDILSVKKDAIFIIGKRCKECSFDNVEFRVKHTYTSFHKFDNIEFYYNRDDLHVKGINDYKLIDHQDYMLTYLKDVFKFAEKESYMKIVDITKRFALEYKQKALDIGYYRELNSNSLYTFSNEANVLNQYAFESIDDDLFETIDIGFNYINYVLPIIQRYFFRVRK
jgi:hypothetical protein